MGMFIQAGKTYKSDALGVVTVSTVYEDGGVAYRYRHQDGGERIMEVPRDTFEAVFQPFPMKGLLSEESEP